MLLSSNANIWPAVKHHAIQNPSHEKVAEGPMTLQQRLSHKYLSPWVKALGAAEVGGAVKATGCIDTGAEHGGSGGKSLTVHALGGHPNLLFRVKYIV